MLFQPDRYFSRITNVSIPHDLLGRGFTHVLLDIDNTVRARDTHGIPRDVGMWLAEARDAGVAFCLLSNNWHASAHAFAGQLDLPIVAKACKPLPHGYALAMRRIGGTRATTVSIGDQLLTDVVGAHLAGMKAYLVQPLVDADLKHTLLLRKVERALLEGGAPGASPVPAPEPQAMCEQTEEGKAG